MVLTTIRIVNFSLLSGLNNPQQLPKNCIVNLNEFPPKPGQILWPLSRRSSSCSPGASSGSRIHGVLRFPTQSPVNREDRFDLVWVSNEKIFVSLTILKLLTLS